MNANDLKRWACNILKTVLQAKAPYDTGNLAINSIRVAEDGSGVFIGGEIAPYAVCTNEPWEEKQITRVTDRGKTITYTRKAKNPNEGWIDKAIQEAKPILKQALSGKMTKAEYEATMKKYNDEIDKRAVHLAEVAAARRDRI